MRQCPKELVTAMLVISAEATKKPWAKQPDTALACALAFFSLQIITPAIVNPYKSGIIVTELSVDILKHFARIGKCFQTWSNEFQAHVAEPTLPIGEGARAVKRLCENIMTIPNPEKQRVTYEPPEGDKKTDLVIHAFELYCKEKKT
jgi:hypothetical protein